METAPLTAKEVERYLGVLDVRPLPAGLAGLRRLVRAHLTQVPFENLSKLWYLRRRGLRDVPDLDLYLDGVRRHHFGGTCYSNNFHLFRLLQALGYRAALYGADMPSGEDVHAAIVVEVDGRSWLVDAGYAAPFLEPLPLDGDQDQELRFGSDRYRLAPRDPLGRSRLELWRHGEPLHGYLLKPTPRSPEHFQAAVLDSFRPQATFLNMVLVVRSFARPRRSLTLSNLSLIRSTPRHWSVERLPDLSALVAAVEREVGIPAAIAGEAVSGLGELGSAYG